MNTSNRERVLRALLLTSLLPACWLAMQVVHELGHVLHCRLAGGVVRQVVLHPLAVSRTELQVNPEPRFIAWGGFVWGVLLPVLAAVLARRGRVSWAYLLQYFVGFCLVVNGVYFVVGTLDPGGDPADLARAGAPTSVVAAVGVVAAALGLAVWNGLGAAFGIGAPAHRTRASHAFGVALVLLLLVAAELLAAGRLYTLE